MRLSPARALAAGVAFMLVLVSWVLAGVTHGSARPTRPPTGYSLNVGIHRRCTQVSNRQQLLDALAAGSKCIFVADTASIDLAQVRHDRPGATVYVPEGVTLESDRSPTAQGGLLYMSRSLSGHRPMLKLAANTRITGLRLRGFDLFDTNDRQDGTDAILISGVEGVLVDNDEIYGWPNAGVEVSGAPNGVRTAARIHITESFIHNNVQCGAGYGVVVGGSGFALIDRNVFNYDRHDVADDGRPDTGYIAESNFVLTSGPTCNDHYNQHFDMHGTGGGSLHAGGTAGRYVAIRDNTIRGDQAYGFLGHLNRPAFQLRGAPVDSARFIDNAVAHSDEDSAVRVDGADRNDLKSKGKLVVDGNAYGVNTAKELVVGDFNGDGHADVFQATGAVWVYSPSGRGAWRILNTSRLRLGRLGLGDFNGDGRTDVFAQDGTRWLVSYGGTSAWQSLPAGSNISIKYYRFGDFDGDGKTDVFRANGSYFYILSGGATGWQQLAKSALKLDKLRFGDFNGDGKTDVFSLANGHWSVSYGGVSHWQRINELLSPTLAGLVFADFDGDGRTDIARSHDGRWEVSYGGATGWRPLDRFVQPGFFAMLFGDFNGDKRADVLQYGVAGSVANAFTSLSRFKLSSAGARSLVVWSMQDML